MGVGGTHHAHVQLMGERDVGGKAAVAGDERPIFETRDRAADEVHRAKASKWAVSLTRCTLILPPAMSISLRQHGDCAIRQ